MKYVSFFIEYDFCKITFIFHHYLTPASKRNRRTDITKWYHVKEERRSRKFKLTSTNVLHTDTYIFIIIDNCTFLDRKLFKAFNENVDV